MRSKQVKYKRVREDLRKQILKGHYPPGAQLPSEDDFVRSLGVSKITLVRALNDLARDGLIVRRHGRGSFVVDPASRPLVPGRNLRLGLLISHSIGMNHQYMQAWEHDVLNAALREWGMTQSPVEFHQNDVGTWAEWQAELKGCTVQVIGEGMNVRPKHPSIEQIKEARLDGVLTLGITDEAWLRELAALRIPIVLLDFSYHVQDLRADVVYFDPFPGYQAAVRALIARGLQRIHFISGLSHRAYAEAAEMKKDPDWGNPSKALPDPESVYRKAAWRIEMEAAGLPCDASQMHASWNSPGEAHLQQLARQLAELPPEQRPQAVVCHGLPQAEEFLREFKQRGIPLQAAGATSGYHQHLGWPIFGDYQQMGKIGAGLLLQRITETADSFLRIGVPLVLPDYLAVPPGQLGR